ncbi:hypothetical protein PIB30_042391 [Stylosanthes scabra]|uniref:DUF4283 domain-containing protein n=1 Tax=Stylosanthes scabra TaxID=79078 RepID=A0ABU6XCX5_9FABA|nr:hypothetical protein [Stylosanthes scabra]
MFVKEAKPRRVEGYGKTTPHNHYEVHVEKTVEPEEMRFANIGDKDQHADTTKKAINDKSIRRINVVPSPKQQDLLNRSIVVESVKPIKFGICAGFKELAKDFGRLECKDFGPSRCIISFESIELRDKTLQIHFMPDLFDKITPYSGFFWNTSRRVWLEVMGLQIHVWCEPRDF